MTPKDLRQSLPLFHDFLERFTPLLVDDKRTESRKERAEAYLRKGKGDAAHYQSQILW